MKKLIIPLFYVLLFCIIGIHSVKASEVPIPVSQINARILPSVWYSTLSINDGDSIKIYSGIQNNSDIDFNGTATFYIDEKNISDVNFTSTKDSLKDISTSWVAVPGLHTIKIKISASLPDGKELVSYESDESKITIVKKLVVEEEEKNIININNDTFIKAKETISSVISTVDEVAIPLSEKIKSFKKTDTIVKNNNSKLSSKSSSSGSSSEPAVLGVYSGHEGTNKDNTGKSAFNIALDGLSFLVKNWLWTLGGVILIILFIKRKKKR